MAFGRKWSWRSGDIAIWSLLLFFFLIAICIVWSNTSLTPPKEAEERRLKSS
jgi:hypothetical protein